MVKATIKNIHKNKITKMVMYFKPLKHCVTHSKPLRPTFICTSLKCNWKNSPFLIKTAVLQRPMSTSYACCVEYTCKYYLDYIITVLLFMKNIVT